MDDLAIPEGAEIPEFEIEEIHVEFKKRSFEDILKDVSNVDPKKISEEVLEWVTDNVEGFLDNHMRIFKLDLVLDDETQEMQEVKKLQDLYRAIPHETVSASDIDMEKLQNADDDDEIFKLTEQEEKEVECRMELDKIAEAAYNCMCEDEERLNKLFERMIFYYEVKCLKDGVPVIQEQQGVAKVLRFEYEGFNMGVKVIKGLDEVNKEEIKKGERTTLKQYVVEEGFTVWVELAFKAKELPKTMF